MLPAVVCKKAYEFPRPTFTLGQSNWMDSDQFLELPAGQVFILETSQGNAQNRYYLKLAAPYAASGRSYAAVRLNARNGSCVLWGLAKSDNFLSVAPVPGRLEIGPASRGGILLPGTTRAVAVSTLTPGTVYSVPGFFGGDHVGEFRGYAVALDPADLKADGVHYDGPPALDLRTFKVVFAPQGWMVHTHPATLVLGED